MLAVLRRDHRDAHVDRRAVGANGERAVLREPLLGDVEAGHDLQSCGDGSLHGPCDRLCPAQDTVDPLADDQLARLRVEVDVRGAVRDRAAEHGVHEVDRPGLLGLQCEILRVELREVLRDVGGGPVRPCERRVQRRGVGDREAGTDSEREAQIVGGAQVRRVADRHLDDVLAEMAHGKRLALVREGLRQQTRRPWLDLDLREVDEGQAVLLGERLADGARARPAVRDEHLAEAPPRVALFRERALDVLRRAGARLHEQLADP